MMGCMIKLLPVLVVLLGGERVALVAGEGLNEPFSVDFDADGRAYIAEMGGHRISVLEAGKLSVLAGTGAKGLTGDGGPGDQATFNGPHDLLVGPDGHIWVADTFNNVVRKIDPRTRRVARVAGTGRKGFAGDGGPAVSADFGGIYSIAFDAQKERLFLCDLDSRRVRVLSVKTGVVTTYAGNGQKGVPRDGQPALSEPLVDPRAVACDSKGNVYILERGGHALRVVDVQGRVRTVAGTGKPGLADGPALQAQLNGPKHLAIDANDEVLIADAESNTIRRYRPKDASIQRVAGTGKKAADGLGGEPEACALARPHGTRVHPATGDIWITDTYNHRVLKFTK
jgi:DNA-binding beta-propeller fold protein YncE